MQLSILDLPEGSHRWKSAPDYFFDTLSQLFEETHLCVIFPADWSYFGTNILYLHAKLLKSWNFVFCHLCGNVANTSNISDADIVCLLVPEATSLRLMSNIFVLLSLKSRILIGRLDSWIIVLLLVLAKRLLRCLFLEPEVLNLDLPLSSAIWCISSSAAYVFCAGELIPSRWASAFYRLKIGGARTVFSLDIVGVITLSPGTSRRGSVVSCNIDLSPDRVRSDDAITAFPRNWCASWPYDNPFISWWRYLCVSTLKKTHLNQGFGSRVAGIDPRSEIFWIYYCLDHLRRSLGIYLNLKWESSQITFGCTTGVADDRWFLIR